MPAEEPPGRPCGNHAEREKSAGQQQESRARKLLGRRVVHGAANDVMRHSRVSQVAHQAGPIVGGTPGELAHGTRSGGRDDGLPRLGQVHEAGDAGKTGQRRHVDGLIDGSVSLRYCPGWTSLATLPGMTCEVAAHAAVLRDIGVP